MRKLLTFWRKKDGASAVEYALMVGLITLAISVAVNSLGKNLSGTFTKAAQALATKAGTEPGPGVGAGPGTVTPVKPKKTRKG